MPYRHYEKWRARWLDETGKQCSKTFDEKKDAAHHEQKMKAKAGEIKRGLRRADPPAKTFADLTAEWMATRALAKRSKKDDESMLRRHLTPAFGALQLREVSLELVERFKATRVGIAKKTIANLLTLLVAMLNFARDLGWLDRVPRIKKPTIRLDENDYQFLRTPNEIGRFLGAARGESECIHALYATAIFTGARAGELAGLRWEDIDFEHRLIAIQRSFDGPTKSGDVRRVPLLSALLPILRAWRLFNALPIVFPNEAGEVFGPSARAFQEVLHRVLDRGGFPKVLRGGKQRAFLRFHDLRHTFASQWMMRGGTVYKLQKILGHKSPQMTARYSHLAPDAFTEDFDRFGPVVETGVVVDMAGRRAGAA